MKTKETSITFEKFLNKVSLKYNETEIELIKKAYNFSSSKMTNMQRRNGDEYTTHVLVVADILLDLNADITTIVAAILHELIFRDLCKIEEIEKEFSKEIATLVENISKINHLEFQNDSESGALYMRKILVGLAEDVRAIFIKLADRLHNMRTLYALNPKKQKETAKETETVLIPIAHRLGINQIKSELEDLCLRYLKPDEYNDVLSHLNNNQEELSDLLNQMQKEISELLNEHNIKFGIKGRVKSVHSIYTKLQTGREFSDIYDILAIRIFVDTESDCYQVLGLIHSKYRSIPRRVKDFIANPKKNMYQSLHTGILGINGELFEIQIRTHEMDEIAEKGIASHWSYKEKGPQKAQNIMEQKLELFRNLIEANAENDNADFITNVNSEFLDKLIYVYTPKGDVVELPKDATPIDFAYRIHSNVGEETIGALVNDKIVTLNSSLEDGDVVTIQTKKGSKPNKEWINFVKTSQAKNKIKAYFSKQDRIDYITKGQELLDKEIKKKKLSTFEILNNKNIKKILKDLKVSSLDDIYLSIGSLRYTPTYILSLIYEDKKDVEDILINKAISHKSRTNDYNRDVIVAGTSDIKVTMAGCCKPIMGDEIIGYITKGQGVSIHKLGCSNIQNEKERLIPVEWNQNSDKYYFTNIIVEVSKDKNYILDIITRASLKEVYVEDYKTFNNDTTVKHEITLRIKSSNDLELFLDDLKQQKFTIEVGRVNI